MFVGLFFFSRYQGGGEGTGLLFLKDLMIPRQLTQVLPMLLSRHFLGIGGGLERRLMMAHAFCDRVQKLRAKWWNPYKRKVGRTLQNKLPLSKMPLKRIVWSNSSWHTLWGQSFWTWILKNGTLMLAGGRQWSEPRQQNKDSVAFSRVVRMTHSAVPSTRCLWPLQIISRLGEGISNIKAQLICR